MPKKVLKSEKGFSLMETVVAMGIGLGMLAAAVQLYTQSLNATFRVSLRAEMQQDVRAAENILIRDISLAGAGLPPGGVALAKGGAKNPIYGCDQAKCYLGGSPASGLAFPGSSTPYMYWLIPGAAVGPTINASVGATDAVTVVQGDTAFPWTDYVMTLNSSGTTGTVTLVTTPPAPVVLLSDAAFGLKTGDLVLVTGKSGGNTINAVGEITSDVTGTGPPYTVQFAANDALGFNQSGATSSALKQLGSLTGTTLTRIWMITYYISTANGSPTLMRQVNGQTPSPVAENIVNLQFDYDTYDDNGNFVNYAAPPSPNLIRKVNILHMTARSELRGAVGYQSMDVQSSVSARNMSFKNRYQ